MACNVQADSVYLLHRFQPARNSGDTSRKRDCLDRIKGQVKQGGPEQCDKAEQSLVKINK